jgi:hypothetical protein
MVNDPRLPTADLRLLGPARQLLRVREKPARVKSVEGQFVGEGDAVAVTATFEFVEDGRRLSIRFDRQAWEDFRQRLDRAFVFVDLPGQARLF